MRTWVEDQLQWEEKTDTGHVSLITLYSELTRGFTHWEKYTDPGRVISLPLCIDFGRRFNTLKGEDKLGIRVPRNTVCKSKRWIHYTRKIDLRGRWFPITLLNELGHDPLHWEGMTNRRRVSSLTLHSDPGRTSITLRGRVRDGCPH